MPNAKTDTQQARTMTIETPVAASPAAVFKALTEADDIQRWWASRAEVEPKVGGLYRVAFEFDDPSGNMTQESTITKFDAPRTFAFAWTDPFPGAKTAVTFTLQKNEEATVVRLDHSGFGRGGPWDAYYEKIHGGWLHFLGNLKSVLEGGEDRREGTGQRLSK